MRYFLISLAFLLIAVPAFALTEDNVTINVNVAQCLSIDIVQTATYDFSFTGCTDTETAQQDLDVDYVANEGYDIDGKYAAGTKWDTDLTICIDYGDTSDWEATTGYTQIVTNSVGDAGTYEWGLYVKRVVEDVPPDGGTPYDATLYLQITTD